MSNHLGAQKRPNAAYRHRPRNTVKSDPQQQVLIKSNINTQQRNSSPLQKDHQDFSTETKRVWVRKHGECPTTIRVYEDDIVDDLKLAIFHKFPNSLAVFYDPSELVLKIDLQSRSTNVNGAKTTSNTSGTYNAERRRSMSPPSTYNYKILEPNQNVAHILDMYYPNGMDMSDSILIEAPYHYATTSNEQGMSNRNSISAYARRDSLYISPARQPNPIYQNYQNSYHSSQNSIGQDAASYYHQPKPQYTYPNKITPSTSSPPKVRSISPTSLNKNIPAPTGSNSFRRTQSSPLYAPTNEQINSQAIVLLPKNFSLTTGSSNTVDRKKANFDDASENSPIRNRILSREQPHTSGSTEQSENESKLSDVNNSENREISKLKYYSNSVSSNERKNSNDHNLAARNSIDGILVSPSPPVDVRALHSPSRTPVNQSENAGYDNLMKTKETLQKKSKGIRDKESPTKSATERVLPSISVLVVEDNAINQAILGAFLRKHKIHYQIAKNGQEAIDKWKLGGFHLVLMDIQLPVKSGIEATKQIRHLEKVNNIGFSPTRGFTKEEHIYNVKDEDKLDTSVFRSPVIIVALTASSHSSVDRKNALTAGCNDYLTKPVNLVWLQNKITEWGCMQALIDFDGWKVKHDVSMKEKSDQDSPKPTNSTAAIKA